MEPVKCVRKYDLTDSVYHFLAKSIFFRHLKKTKNFCAYKKQTYKYVYEPVIPSVILLRLKTNFFFGDKKHRDMCK
jgi:hypothetical protein